MPYQFRGFGARGRVVFSPNQAVWQANQPTITQVVFASGDPSPEVEVSANTDSIIEVTLASDLVGTITIEGVDYHIEDNSGTVVFASGQPEEHTFSGPNDFTIVSGAITSNEYQVLYLGTGSIKYQIRPSRFVFVPIEEDSGSGPTPTGDWSLASEEQKIIANDALSSDQFGYSASISSDGNTAIVGARLEDTGGSNAGAAYIFTRSGSTWTEEAKLTASDAQNNDNFGHSTSISSDGNTAIVGAPYEDTGGNGAGSAYIFTRSGTAWTEQAKITAGDAQASDQFGWSVSLSSDGNTAIVGARGEDAGGTGAGAAYIFTRSGSAWTEQAKIIASDAQNNDTFGESVSISGDGNTAIIGAYQEDTGGSNAGAAYIFTRSGSAWTEQAKIQAGDVQSGDIFGYSTSISSDGNTVIIGAYFEDSGGPSAGAAYVFTRSGSTWTEEAKLTASDAAVGDFLGVSTSISSDGNTAIIGAYQEDTGGTDAGAAYIFTRSGSTWTEEAKLTASDAQAHDYFGYSTSISSDGNTAIVGAYLEDTGGTNAGAAYIFVAG